MWSLVAKSKCDNKRCKRKKYCHP